MLDAVEVLAPVELPETAPPTQPNVALAAQGAKATASSVWSPAYTPDKAIDGNAETRWNSARGDVAGSWLAVDFGTPRTISMIAFTEAAGGTLIDDTVRYVLPMGALGRIALPIVRAQLQRIFAYRQEAVRRILVGENS